jgi:nitroreductase
MTANESTAYDYSRLAMPVGEAMFSQRSIRRFRPDPIPMEDVRAIVEAAMKAPSGGNRQWTRLLVVNDPERVRAFAPLYREAWWAKRRDEGIKGPEDIPETATVARSAMRLAESFAEVPLVVFVLANPPGPANSVITCAQNLMLAARALGIGSCPTTLHDEVMERFYTMFGIPEGTVFHFCVPMGYPRGRFGPTSRLPASRTTYLNAWKAPVPWE